MKFTLHRKPDSKVQKIPYAALQIAGLADAEANYLYGGPVILPTLTAKRPSRKPSVSTSMEHV